MANPDPDGVLYVLDAVSRVSNSGEQTIQYWHLLQPGGELITVLWPLDIFELLSKRAKTLETLVETVPDSDRIPFAICAQNVRQLAKRILDWEDVSMEATERMIKGKGIEEIEREV